MWKLNELCVKTGLTELAHFDNAWGKFRGLVCQLLLFSTLIYKSIKFFVLELFFSEMVNLVYLLDIFKN